jgi:Lar family restriction alleviation protein
MTEREEALLPCPFCGVSPFAPIYDDWPINKHFVICDECATEGPHADTEAEAIAAWNRRAPSAAEAEMREALKAYMHAMEGFAEAVRAVTGTAYPWEAQDIARAKALAALSKEPGK